MSNGRMKEIKKIFYNRIDCMEFVQELKAKKYDNLALLRNYVKGGR
jgi:hypothetical protein